MRPFLVIAAVMIALLVVASLPAYVLQDSPEEVTCTQIGLDAPTRDRVVREVADDLDAEGHPRDRVRRIVSDLRGTIGQRLER
jgi:hypothetical protein